MIVNVQGSIFYVLPVTSNEDPDTFDIIRIEILLRAFSDNSIELCREHKGELLETVDPRFSYIGSSFLYFPATSAVFQYFRLYRFRHKREKKHNLL